MTGLSFLPSTGANVSWGLRDNWETGINYRGNFFPVSGISVDNQIVWNNDRLLSPVASGSVITIATGAAGTLNVLSGAEVTVISQGQVNNIWNTTLGSGIITLNISEDATVIWKADYHSAIMLGSPFVVNGDGTLDVVAGSISSNASNTIHTTSNSTIIVSGAVVSNHSLGTAINSTGWGGTVEISDGIVKATHGQAINVSNTGIFRITGGLVVAQRGLVINNAFGVVNRNPNAISGTGTIVGYTLGIGTYSVGSIDGLTFLPNNAQVFWGLDNEQVGIVHPNGFLVVDGAELGTPIFRNSTIQRSSASIIFAGIKSGQIYLNLRAGNYTAELYNLQGRMLKSVDINAISGVNAIGLRTDNLADGILILNVKYNGVSVLRQRIGVNR
jgi:hypothetical protein